MIPPRGISEMVLATRNKKKLEEIGRITSGFGIKVRSLAEFSRCPEVEETADTFEGNALKKAREICACTGLVALADDSGLEVDALGGAPGVYSARYAGEGATDARNVSKLLHALGDNPRRGARFRCVIALVTLDEEEAVFDGKVEGAIGHEEQGSNGFGYDPIFFPEGHGRTFAQMDAVEKDSMSHRGRALEKFAAWLKGG